VNVFSPTSTHFAERATSDDFQRLKIVGAHFHAFQTQIFGFFGAVQMSFLLFLQGEDARRPSPVDTRDLDAFTSCSDKPSAIIVSSKRRYLVERRRLTSMNVFGRARATRRYLSSRSSY
jgi:hypothetical protein